MVAKYVYRKSDNRFMGGGFFDAQPPMVLGPPDPQGNPTQVPDFTNYGIAESGDADQPDLRLHRFDPATGGKRLATAQELTVADDADVLEKASVTSRQRDIAATIAFAIRNKDVAAWNAMTNTQKKTAVLAGCDAWRDLRTLVDKLV